MSVQDLIAGVGDRLTPTERRIAEVVSRDATLLAFGTVSDLAERAGTSRPSIVRFATKLGFSGYSELQAWVRVGVSRQLSSPSARIRRLDGGSADIRSGIADAVQRVFDALDPERLADLAAPVVAERRVWVLSGETSMAGARVLQSGLSMVRSDVHLVHEHSVGRDLCSAVASCVLRHPGSGKNVESGAIGIGQRSAPCAREAAQPVPNDGRCRAASGPGRRHGRAQITRATAEGQASDVRLR